MNNWFVLNKLYLKRKFCNRKIALTFINIHNIFKSKTFHEDS